MKSKVALWKLINVNLNDVEKQQCIDEIVQDLNILEKYKQIEEEEISCSLDILFQALKNGIYVKDLIGLQYVKLNHNKILNYFYLNNTDIANNSKYICSTKNYKITWSLKKEELENEN